MMSYLFLFLAIGGLQEWEEHLIDMNIAAAEKEIQTLQAEDSLNVETIMAGVITTLVFTDDISGIEADSLYSDLLGIQQDNTPSAFILTALGYLEMYRNNSSDSSQYYFENALLIDSTFIPARFGYGSLLVLQGDEKEGMSVIDFDLRLSTSLLVAYFKTAYLKTQEGRDEELLEVYRIALENYPDEVKIFSEYVAALYSAGRQTQSESVFYAQIGPLNLIPEEALYYLANIYADNECWYGAIDCYESLISMNSENENYYVEVGWCFEMTGSPDTAREMYVKALQINPHSGLANYYLGMLELLADNRELATDYVIKATVSEPLYTYDAFNLALTYENDEDIESLVYLFQQMLEVDTLVSYAEEQLGFDMSLQLASNLQYLDRYEEALDIYHNLIAEDSTRATVWRLIGFALEDTGDYAGATSVYSDAIENVSLSETPWFYGQLGYLAVDEKDTDAALAYYTEAVIIDSLYNYGWKRIGILTVQTGDYQTALYAMDKSLETGSDSLFWMAGRILSLEGIGRDAEADELEAEFRNIYSAGWIDYVYQNLSKGDSLSLAIAEKAEEYYKGSHLLLCDLAYLYDYLAVPFRADSCFIAAVRINPNNTKILDNYAEYLSGINRNEEAIELYLMISEIDSLDIGNWNVLGEKLLFSDRLDEAENAFLTSLSIESEQAWVLAYLGYLYELREDIDRALDYYFTTLDLSPGYEYAEGRISNLTNPYYSTPGSSASSDNLFAQISFSSNVEIGDTHEKKFYLGCDIEYEFDDRGSNIELDADYTFVESSREWVDYSNWTTIELSSARHIAGDFSFVLSSEWDRQPDTVRPWQVTSSLSGAYGKWIKDWLFMYPEIGIGMVNTQWSKWPEDERTDVLTTFGSLFLQFSNYEKNWPVVMLYGDFYIPPDDTDGLIASSFIELGFDIWDPVSFTIGYTLDYTRTPLYEYWEKYDTRFYTRFNVRIF